MFISSIELRAFHSFQNGVFSLILRFSPTLLKKKVDETNIHRKVIQITLESIMVYILNKDKLSRFDTMECAFI